MTDDKLTFLRELDALATPGPWYVHFTDDDYAMNATFVSTVPPAEHEDDGRGLGEGWPEQVPPSTVIAITLLQHPRLADVSDGKWDVNARLVVATRTHLNGLLAEIDRLRAENADLMRQLGDAWL